MITLLLSLFLFNRKCRIAKRNKKHGLQHQQSSRIPKEEKKSFISKIIPTINKKEQPKKNEPTVVNSPEKEADHLNLRKSNESYFRDPTIKQ